MNDYPPLPKYPTSGLEHSPAPNPRGLPPASRTRAGWALGLSLIPGVITLMIGTILAITVLVDSAHDGRDHGKRLAIAAICAAGVWTVVLAGIGLYMATAGVERNTEGDVVEEGRVRVSDLTEGDCLPGLPRETAQHFVNVVPCSQPHLGEVYATFDLRSFTTLDEVNAVIDGECYERFGAYVGTDPATTSLEVRSMQPVDRNAFTEDPQVSCLGFVTQEREGSIEGSGL